MTSDGRTTLGCRRDRRGSRWFAVPARRSRSSYAPERACPWQYKIPCAPPVHHAEVGGYLDRSADQPAVCSSSGGTASPKLSE